MPFSHRPERSLKVLAIEALGGGNPEPSYEGILEIWKSLLRHVVEDSGIEFLNKLSRAEYVSLSILREWWYRYPSIAESFAYHRIMSQNSTGLDIRRPIPHFFDMEVHGVLYHHALSLLFIGEFAPRLSKHLSLSGLRNQAAREASTHNIATKFCLNGFSLFPKSSTPDLSQFAEVDPLPISHHQSSITATLEACPWLSRAELSGRPHYLWDVAQNCTLETKDLREEPYICISHTWGRWIDLDSAGHQIEVSVEGVPWPIPKNSRFDVQLLPRLLQNANFRERYVWFDLLCIPQCGHLQHIMDAEIARQAAIFASSRLAGAWLNDIDNWVGTQHALRWLSALYFDQMSWGPSFRFGSTLRDFTSLPQSHSPILNIDPSELWQSAECMPPCNEASDEGFLSDWFTSLWTLQEACLRPDMILYDKHWRPLKISGDDVIHLDGLIALVRCASMDVMNSRRFHEFYDDFVERECLTTPEEKLECVAKYENNLFEFSHEVPDWGEVWPVGPMQLGFIVDHALIVNTYEGPSGLLRCGDKRFCSGRRAEAIMSALGATKWYPEYKRQATIASGQVVSEPNLVLDKYPVEFLSEVIQRYGSDFFASTIFHMHLSPREIQKMFTVTVAPIGSMLPFSAAKYDDEGFQKRSQYIEVGGRVEDHPTVKGWTIQSDGTVRIREAGIMAASQKTSRSPSNQYWARMCLIAPLIFEEGQCNKGLTSEAELCEVIPTYVNLFMVCLGDGLLDSYGIILQKIASQLMIKVGTWHSVNVWEGSEKPKYRNKTGVPSTQVDWTVL